MITDVPSSGDFMQSGVGLLNLAWENACELLYLTWDQRNPVPQMDEDYWRAAQSKLSIALALAQQGIEFLLKAKIASLTPYLLISGSPKDWPAGCGQNDTPFSEFRTVDSQDLVKLCNTVITPRLSDSFRNRHERLRRFRNTVFHTVNKTLQTGPLEVLLTILEASEDLIGSKKWISVRKHHLISSPLSVAYDTDWIVADLSGDLERLADVLEPAELLRYFGFHKKHKRYICSKCTKEGGEHLGDDTVKLAQLTPNTPTSTTIYCIVCEQNYVVIRHECIECGNTVINAEGNKCLTCDSYPIAIPE